MARDQNYKKDIEECFMMVSKSGIYYLQAILFDQKYKQFVGNCWRGKAANAKNKMITFNQSFYFYSSIPGNELLLVVELFTRSDKYNCDRVSGWMFSGLSATDEDDSSLRNSVSYKIPLIHGTPNALLIFKEASKGINVNNHSTGMEMSLTLSPYPTLLKIAHLVPRNILIDPTYEVPGVVPIPSDVLNSSSYSFKPQLQKCITFELERLRIKVHPSLEIAERNVLQKIRTEHEEAGSTFEVTSKACIIERRLQVDIHNGYCFIQEPDYYHLHVESIVTPITGKSLHRSTSMGSLSLSRDENLVLRSDIKLPNVPDDPNIYIVFLLEYIISLPSSSGKNSTASVISVDNTKSVDSTPEKTHMSVETSYFSSPAQKNSGPKHKSLGDIPMTVTKGEVGGRKISKSEIRRNENNMNLQEVVLVSSSLPLVPPMLHTFPAESGIPFKAFTKLYWNKLQPILDHNGKPAASIDTTVPYNVDKTLEISSPPQRNECFIQFLALFGLEEYAEVPEQVFFTFQFYRFPPCENLILKPLFQGENDSASTSLAAYVLYNPRDKDNSPGFQVTYNVDPSELDQGEYKPFLFHCMKHCLHVDVWNGQSLLYFGTVAVPLKYLCRQGKEAVSAFLELDVINCEFADESLVHTALPVKTHRGKLYVRLASIRHPLTAKALEKFEDNEVSSEALIICSRNESNVNMPRVSRAKPIVETNRELSRLLASRCVLNNEQKIQTAADSAEQRRKVAHMDAVRNLLNGEKPSYEVDESLKNYSKERQRDILSIESYIQKNKTEMIQSLLHSSITSEKAIYPIFGSKLFFEFILENPFQEERRIEITWKCSELNLVTDLKLWKKLRNMHNLSQNIDTLSFSSEPEVPTILLRPREKVNIPFTYYSLEIQSNSLDIFKTSSGHHFTADLLSAAPISNNLTPSSVKVRFMTEEQTLLAVLILKIQPLLPSVTHVFKFLSMEHSMFKKSIRINNESNSKYKLNAKCSDLEVVCCIQEVQGWEEDVSVQIKAPTRAAGKCKEFYLFIYKDVYQIAPQQTWLLSICPLQRIDLSCIAGQLMQSSLLIRGTHATNLVKCFSSSKDLQLHPSEPFVLSPFAVQELSMNVRSLLPGTKYFQITMVNQALEKALQSWLLVLSCQKPSVSKAFQVHLSVGKEATKRITYTNPYHRSRSFILHCSHPQLLYLREWEFTVPAGKSYVIGLYFVPQQFVFSETIFLYLNDVSEKNEETYCIKVICQ
ncbi:nephrocystin-4-like [Uloborus diversus]|uniref:nephrocystin-4-like n=1 Tax=Uloborus diversus TaxID=327109 RepID=UPI002409536F|nr:nephrocystin-4-like [Uloborus diversus]